MRHKINILTAIAGLFFMLSFSWACSAQPVSQNDVVVGAERLDILLPILKGKKVGMVINQTSKVKNALLLDTLYNRGVNITAVFAPEHGFRGEADAGAKVDNEIDLKTRVPIYSIYGNNKKPSVGQMNKVDIILFDLQDVGARFYTYISTLHYVMEAAAENGKMVIILDRPNPNGHYVDGPVLEKAYTSFVGMHPIPIVHGMTIGEYAQMINGERWLKGGVQCKLQVIKIKNYNHRTYYNLPVAPSPNLPNMRSIYLYPSLCLFEGTPYSVGRGTNKQFQLWGHPQSSLKDTSFTPVSRPGAKNPPLLNQLCYGKSYRDLSTDELRQFGFSLQPIIDAYKTYKGQNFFNSFFMKLSGTRQLEEQIKAGLSEKEIRLTWQEDLVHFKQIRKKYLLYDDFE
ncbi:MAG: DUF1343 domain-containing protein [Chitinophagales bacterium]|nr:DUF1343 domain-containing protein [Chitinophagales bacterium]